MATLKIVLRTDKKPDKKGEYQLHLRLTHNRKLRYVKAFPFNLREDQWSKRSQTIRATHPRYAQYNQKINEVFDRAQEELDFCLMDDPHATTDHLRDAIDFKSKARSKDFIKFSNEIIDGFRDEERIRYANRCTHVIKKLDEYSDGYLPFKKMDVAFLRRYKTYLKKEKNNSPNTIHGNFKVMRTFYRQAILEGLATQADNPFFLFSVKTETVHKEHMSLDHIIGLSRLDLAGKKDVIRDSFLFSFWCAGIRFSDVCKLQWANISNGAILDYTMGKTKASAGSRKIIDLSPPALQIIDKYNRKVKAPSDYIFPWLQSGRKYTAEERVDVISSKNAYTNMVLKDLAKEIGFRGRLTFHLSRHTFTSIADEVADLSVKEIQSLLGHTDTRTTEIYRNSLNKTKDAAAMKKFFETVQSKAGGSL